MARVLEEHMNRRQFVVGDSVTVGDFVLAYTLDWANEVSLLEGFPNLQEYVARMYARPRAPLRIAEAFASINTWNDSGCCRRATGQASSLGMNAASSGAPGPKPRSANTKAKRVAERVQWAGFPHFFEPAGQRWTWLPDGDCRAEASTRCPGSPRSRHGT